MNRQELAKFGEDQATVYLQSLGYKILERNFKCKIGEIDIIAIDNDTLVFVEVKARYEDDQVKPDEAISKHKLWLVGRSGEFYKDQHDELPELLRIDAVLIEIDSLDKLVRLELIKDCKL